MVIEEFAQVLDFLEIDPYIVGWSADNSEAMETLLQESKEFCLDESKLPGFIWNLDNAHNEAKKINPDDLTLPFYSIMIAYAYHAIPDWPWALKYAKRATTQFNTQGQIWNKAISSWFSGLLLYANGQFDSADIFIKNAVDEISSFEEIDYQEIVEKIDQTISLCQNQVRERIIDLHELKASIDDFFLLISSLDFFENDDLYHDLEEILEDRKILSSDNIELINFYVNDLSKHLSHISQNQIEDGSKKAPFIHFFLAYCYTLRYFGEDRKNIYLAIQATDKSVHGFQQQGNIYNQAISSLYLALLHFNLNNRKDSSRKMTEANHLLWEIHHDEEQDPDFSNKIDNLKNYLAEWIDIFKNQPRGTTAGQNIIQRSLDYLKNIIEQLIPIAPELNDNMDFKLYPQNSEVPYGEPSPPGNQPERLGTSIELDQSEELVSPAEVDQLVELNQPKEQESLLEPDQPEELVPPVEANQSDESDQLVVNEGPHRLHITIPIDVEAMEDSHYSSIPMERALFKKLQKYHENITQNRLNIGEGNFEEESIPDPTILIPSFPLYGEATAGPSGKAFLDDENLEDIDPVDASLQAILGGKKHKIRFVDNNQITFVKGKRYGWLQVRGESMNKAKNNPINNDDYVLFQENHDLDTCSNCIVVALLPEFDPPQLVVKRLIKMSADSLFRTDGFGAKVKFTLESESHDDKDPDFQSEINVTNDYQIVGNVVAIAKPIEKTKPN